MKTITEFGISVLEIKFKFIHEFERMNTAQKCSVATSVFVLHPNCSVRMFSCQLFLRNVFIEIFSSTASSITIYSSFDLTEIACAQSVLSFPIFNF